LSVEHLTLQGTNIFIIVAVPLDLLHCVFNIHPTATLPYLYLSSTLHLGISMLPYPTFGQLFVFLLAGNLAISLFRLNLHQNQKISWLQILIISPIIYRLDYLILELFLLPHRNNCQNWIWEIIIYCKEMVKPKLDYLLEMKSKYIFGICLR
jgi:biotin transporter BioY